MPPRTRAAASQLSRRVSPEAAAPPAKRHKSTKSTVEDKPALLPPTLSFSLPNAISHLTKVDPRFELFFEHLPCRPFVHLEAIDPFRTLVTSIIGQQVSWLAARAINNRFRALYGFDPESKEGFPSPALVEKEDVTRLKSVGLSTRKAEYDEEISKALIAVRGIGQWTVDMFLMFSLRRPDVLAVGDLGVQKGLLRWALSAHGALPRKAATPKKGKAKVAERAEIDTVVRDVTPERTVKEEFPPTPSTPTSTHRAAIQSSNAAQIPPTPNSPGPGETVQIPAGTLPPPAPQEMLTPPTNHPDWNPQIAAPLTEALSVEVLKSRLAGKKVKGGMYLTPKEMEDLTANWRPYRSLAVFYMWPAAEES